jgi:hypothetical protein
MSESQASAYLFSNGNSLFFDNSGKQIPDLQKLGLCGLHQFIMRYPESPVFWAQWREAAYPIPSDSVPWLLRHLRRTPGPRPDVPPFDDQYLSTRQVETEEPEEEIQGVPYIGFGNETLEKLPCVKAGDEIPCSQCGRTHILQAGTGADGQPSEGLLFYKCGDTSYLGAVKGRVVTWRKPDVSGVGRRQ